MMAVLIDPDKTRTPDWDKIILLSSLNRVDFFFVGGSVLAESKLAACIKYLKANTRIPVIIFPGNETHIHPDADAILLLSLISGRNSDLLIGKHVKAAFDLVDSAIEVIPTGYILIDGGKETAVSMVSQTTPIPADDWKEILSTAIAGQLLGLKLIYLEAGSGASRPVHKDIINQVKNYLKIPLIIGGGIDTEKKFSEAIEAGADIVVVGNIVEKNPLLIEKFSKLLESKFFEADIDSNQS